MTLSRSTVVAVLFALLFVLLHCALAYADSDFSFFRRSGGGGGGGGRSGPLDADAFMSGVFIMGASVCIIGGALVFLHAWLLTSLAAAKFLAVLGVFSFLAHPLFVLFLAPPLVTPLFGAWVAQRVWISDPYSSWSMLCFLACAALVYFYLLNILMAAFSPAPWGRRAFRASVWFFVICGIGGAFVLKGFFPLLFFLVCSCCAWIAWTVHRKSVDRVARRTAAK